MNGKFNANAGCDDENDSRNSTQLYTEQTHQTEYLQNYHAKHHDLYTSNVSKVQLNSNLIDLTDTSMYDGTLEVFNDNSFINF